MPERQTWLIKSEPSAYAYAQLEKDRETEWTGIRNFEARNNLRAMRKGDLALFYHSNDGKEIVAVARILSAARPDPTAKDGDWVSVKVGAGVALKRPVTLAVIKATPELVDFPLLTRSRLSVTPVSSAQFRRILRMAQTPFSAVET